MNDYWGFRPVARIVTVLIIAGIALSFYQLARSLLDYDTRVVFMMLEILLNLVALYATFRRRTFGWWLLLVAAVLAITTWVLKVITISRLGIMNMGMMESLAFLYGYQLLMLPLLFTYDVRRHFRLVPRRKEASGPAFP